MKQDRRTKEKLLKAAKEEFLDKGYMKASLRSICRKAGVTTGAMYFSFQDKEELFGTLVEKPLREIYDMMKAHYDEEAFYSKEDISKIVEMETVFHDIHSGGEVALQAVEHLYRYREEFLLLLTKAQGSKYENCIDAFVELSEQHCRRMADVMDHVTGRKGLDEDTLHCIVHMQMTAFTQPITHGLSLERAKTQITAMVKFLVAGWYGLWQ